MQSSKLSFYVSYKKNQLPFKQGGARRRNPIICETFEFQMIHMQFRKHSFSIWCDKLESQENKFLFHQLISRCTYSAYLFKLTRKKRMYGYQGVKVVRFKESLACFVFFLPSLFCIITDVLIFAHISALKMQFPLKTYIEGVQQKRTSNFEGQYRRFSFNKNHQRYTNTTP